MNGKPLFLRPVTRLYFGRPGALPAGEAHTGNSWFPPPISAFQGMIRTRLLDEAGIFHPAERVGQLVGRPEQLPDGWRLQGPFPFRRKPGPQMWLPMPAMLMSGVDKSGRLPVTARFLETTPDELLMDKRVTPGLALLGAPQAGGEKPASGWLSCRNMFAILSGRIEQWKLKECCPDLPPFVCREVHTGLARDKEVHNNELFLPGRAREGMLYTLSMLRFAPESGLCGWFSGPLDKALTDKALEKGTVAAGKKGGLIAFERQTEVDPAWRQLADGAHLVKQEHGPPVLVWLILLTPGRWKGMSDAAALLAETAGLDEQAVRVRGSICPPLVHLGGFSMATGQAREAHPWYAPGTSLLVELKLENNRDSLAIVQDWNNRCLLAPPDRRPFGYGHVLAAYYQGGRDGK